MTCTLTRDMARACVRDVHTDARYGARLRALAMYITRACAAYRASACVGSKHMATGSNTDSESLRVCRAEYSQRVTPHRE